MKSIAFPDIFSSSRTNIVEDREATKSNLKLLLKSFKKELFGDPYYGTNLRRFLYEQNSYIIRDLVVDDIYSAIQTFMPQLVLKRDNIKVESTGTDVIVTIDCYNLINQDVDLYQIALTSEE